MIDIIEALSTDETFSVAFCKNCPAISETPGDVTCPTDFEPFYNSGCVKSQEIDAIEAAVREAEIAIAEAV